MVVPEATRSEINGISELERDWCLNFAGKLVNNKQKGSAIIVANINTKKRSL